MNTYQKLSAYLTDNNFWEDIISSDKIDYYSIDTRPHELRFIFRETTYRILQEELLVTAHFKEYVYFEQDMINKHSKYIWFDVPFAEE